MMQDLASLAAVRSHQIEQMRSKRDRLNREIKQHNVALLNLGKIETSLSWMVDKVYGGAIETMQGILNYGMRATYERELIIRVSRDIAATGPRLTITVDDGEAKMMNPISSHGGGVVAILDFLVRMSAIMASGKRRLMVLDEPFAAVSKNIQPLLSDLIRELVDRLDFQIILVTHQEDLAEAADLVHRVAAPGHLEPQDHL